MKSLLLFLSLTLLFVSCGPGASDEEKNPKENNSETKVDEQQENDQSSAEVPFDIHMDELFGDWVLIGIGADRMGPGIAPVGEILFAFRDNGNMTVATEGRQEIAENLAGIPSPYTIDNKKLCSDDIVFKLQFKQPCAEIIRLNEGRMSVEIEIPGGGKMYKHFVKLDQ